MTPTSVLPQRRVLIVDQSREAREVLKTILERRGIQTLEASEARAGLELARKYRPNVIVLDLECKAADEASVRRQYDAESTDSDTSLVVLGTVPRFTPQQSNEHVVSKPYHYAPLVRTIEQLVDRTVAVT